MTHPRCVGGQHVAPSLTQPQNDYDTRDNVYQRSRNTNCDNCNRLAALLRSFCDPWRRDWVRRVAGSASRPGTGISPGTLFSPKDTDYWKFPVVGGKKYRVTVATPDLNDEAIELQALVLNSKGSAVSRCFSQQAGTKEICTTPPATATAKGFFFVKIPENFFAKSYTLSVKSD